jgi:RNA polymerase sigma-70 factor (ECF subfamily)
MDFTKLYKDNYEGVRRVCYSYLKNEEDTADAIQDTFLKASQSLDSFNDHSAIGTWLIKIAKNVCSDKLKARRRDAKVYAGASDGKELWSDQYQDVASPEAILEAEDNAAEMLSVFDQLNSNTKQAVTLRYIDDLSMKEIAEKMGVPVGTAKTWVHRGRTHLLGMVSPQ